MQPEFLLRPSSQWITCPLIHDSRIAHSSLYKKPEVRAFYRGLSFLSHTYLLARTALKHATSLVTESALHIAVLGDYAAPSGVAVGEFLMSITFHHCRWPSAGAWRRVLTILIMSSSSSSCLHRPHHRGKWYLSGAMVLVLTLSSDFHGHGAHAFHQNSMVVLVHALISFVGVAADAWRRMMLRSLTAAASLLTHRRRLTAAWSVRAARR
jgi:hypothetical protein